MLWVWITLCIMWQGTSSFMIHNKVERLCLEDSLGDAGVQLKRCSVDSELQQWVWTERMFLMNVHTQRCLSAFHSDPIQTLECDGEDYLQWQCMDHRLISMSHSLELGVQQGSLTLINTGKRTRWTSLDQGDICQEKLRSRKQRDTDEFPSTEDTMTEEQREYLRWYYRTEDATPWKFAMLGLSLVVLLMGCVLCIMGLMSNKHRREIAKYKTATAASPALVKVEMEELQIITVSKEDKNSYPDPTQDGQLESKAPLEEASETEALNPGEIMVTWKDGTASKLYSDSNEEGEEDK
ncbi:solute carrier family 51 subunit beta [Tachysurus vachellii]|uniref:solute carrier family 51 subunit beta n=1 Tax=Tachysurus vachellii TaxID=175792 RepID=UPI00296AEAA0|nr:solute carrier family 51 subunit beta [Tachysurus vachellii]